MMKLLGLTIFFGTIIIVLSEKARYDHYRMYIIDIKTEIQLKVLTSLENYHDGIIFIDSPYKVPQTLEFIVPPHKFAHIKALFDTYNIPNSIKVDNFQELIDNEQPKKRCSDFCWKQYNDLPAFNKWLDDLLQRYPNILTEYVFGKSFENRPLRAIKISHKQGNPVIFIESTIHAREWISAATVSYFISQLLTSNDTEIQTLAQNYDWMIVPILNVDGYDYTHRKDRMWRKNRTPSSENPICYGTDLNRNFDFHHGDVGSTKDPCSEKYAGLIGFSEPETFALANFIKTIDNLKLYLAFHSYGQILIFPYGHTTEHVPNFDDLTQVGKAAVTAMGLRYGTEYETGSVAELLYFASGASIDWVYATQNVSLAYTLELRDKVAGKYGYILPSEQIIPNSLEVIDGLKAMIKKAKSLRYL